MEIKLYTVHEDKFYNDRLYTYNIIGHKHSEESAQKAIKDRIRELESKSYIFDAKAEYCQRMIKGKETIYLYYTLTFFDPQID